MKKTIALLISCILMATMSLAQVNPIAGVYKYTHPDGAEGTIYVATGQGGNVYFEASSVTSSGNTANFHPDNRAWQRIVGNKVVCTSRFEKCTYTLTLTFDKENGTLTASEKYDKWAPIFGMGATLSGVYRKEPGVVGDNNGYLYSVMSDGTLGVTKGGRYCGTVRIPESLTMADGTEKTVSTVRKYAMQVSADESSSNPLREVILPSSVKMVGVDAFAGNRALESVVYGNPNSVYVEAGAYMSCPSLKLTHSDPIYGYCDYQNSDRAVAYSKFMYPVSEAVKGSELAKYKWACFKHWHNRIGNPIGHNIGVDNTMACYSIWSKVSGYIYSLRDPKQGPNMFWGYEPFEAMVMMVDNNYMGTHRFPQYNRWKYGEDTIFMSNNFKAQMQKRYGRKVLYSCQAAKLRDDGRTVSVTEFEITNNEALVVVAWSMADKIICTWEKRRKLEDDNVLYGVWNVDDDGTYGIPSVLCIAEGDGENVDIVLVHPAPESVNIIQLSRNGDMLEERGGEQWYVWYD